MEFQRRGESIGFGAENTLALNLEQIELQLMKRVRALQKEGSIGKMCQRKEMRNYGTSME